MIPPRILAAFSAVPEELIALCRPHRWEDLTAAPGPGMRSIRDIMVHIVAAETHWIEFVIQRGERPRIDPAAFPDLAAVHAAWAARRRRTVSFVHSLAPEDWGRACPLPRDPTTSVTIGEIAWHVVTHEQYHRGQIFTRLGLLGRRDLPDYDLLR